MERQGGIPEVILDTNVFVAAGFNRQSSAARIIGMVRRGEVGLVWDERIKRETERIVRQIPRLKWEEFVGLFGKEREFSGEVRMEGLGGIEDAEDRKFAALARASGAVLVSSDRHLLAERGRMEGVKVMSTGEFVRGVKV